SGVRQDVHQLGSDTEPFAVDHQAVCEVTVHGGAFGGRLPVRQHLDQVDEGHAVDPVGEVLRVVTVVRVVVSQPLAHRVDEGPAPGRSGQPAGVQSRMSAYAASRPALVRMLAGMPLASVIAWLFLITTDFWS